MSYKKTLLLLLIISSNKNYTASRIKHIFVDINAVIATSKSAASKYVGIFDSVKYSTKVGHFPAKADLFKALKKTSAKSSYEVHNENLLMPAIFSDWFLGLQTNAVIKGAIHTHLDQSKLSNIEKTIFKNISNMMLTPANLIDTQYVLKDVVKMLHHIKKSGHYSIYLIGNWDKESQPLLMKMLQNHNWLSNPAHCFFSNKVKKIKPQSDFYTELLSHYNVDMKECLIIDVEKQHAQESKKFGISTIHLQNHNVSQLKSELAHYGIKG